MNHFNWRKSLVLRKLRRYGFACIRPISRVLETKDSLPPVIVNSFPKSGTHLLIQLIAELPITRDWGLFLASTPSVTFSEVSPPKMSSKIRGISANELVSAHLFHSSEVATALKEVGAIHFFIYRDLRGVAISEAEYLYKMNPWHRLHPYFHKLHSLEERIDLAIDGLPLSTGLDYPNIAERFRRYQHWLDCEDVLSLRYEDLMGSALPSKIDEIVSFYDSRTNFLIDKGEITIRMSTAINPAKSHTFRSGKINGWKGMLTAKQELRITDLCGPMLEKLGYD